MRFLPLILLALIAAIQYPLWLGKGGWFRVWALERQLDEQRQTNAGLLARNAALDAEVRDLKSGGDAVEERARSELGMIRADEVFVQVIPASAAPPVAPTPAQPAVTPPGAARR